MQTIKFWGTLFVTSMTIMGCSDDGVENSSTSSNRAYASKGEAQAASPTGLYCEVQVPISRGRGGGLEGKYETKYYPGYLRGDINADGLINRTDAMIAVKNLFDPNKFTCPATADIGGYPQTTVPDGFFTSQDTVLWNQFKQSGVITWPNTVLCADTCVIVNHMQP